VVQTADLVFTTTGWELLETPLGTYDETYHVVDTGAGYSYTDEQGAIVDVPNLNACSHLDVKHLDSQGKLGLNSRPN